MLLLTIPRLSMLPNDTELSPTEASMLPNDTVASPNQASMLPNDTDPKVARMQVELIRQMSPARRFAMMASWSKMLLRASYRQMLERHSTEHEARIAWVRQLYGNEVADRLEKHL